MAYARRSSGGGWTEWPRRWRLLALALVALTLAPLLPARPVAAHPAGLLLNRWAKVEVEPDTTYIHYVLDLGEFATMLDTGSYQQLDGTVDDEGRAQYAADRARELRVGLHLRFNDVEVPLHIDSYYAEIRQVDAALPALRLEVLYRAATPPLPLTGSLVDDNWSFTLGWREMLVTAGQVLVLVPVGLRGAQTLIVRVKYGPNLRQTTHGATLLPPAPKPEPHPPLTPAPPPSGSGPAESRIAAAA